MDQQNRWLPPTPHPVTDPHAAAGLPARERRPLLRRVLTPLIVAGVLALKWAAKLKGLLLVLPKLKVLTTSASMLVSVAAYSLIWGWRFALGFVVLLFVHEFGHYIQLRREGVRPTFMVFIPFLGAAVGARSLGGSAIAEARVGLAGPILGSLACAALLPVAAATDEPFWHALAFTGFFLNLFNLIPMVPFDGGRAMAAMAPWMWFVGFAAMLAFFIAVPNPILILFLLLGGTESWRRWKARKRGDEGNAAYYRVTPRQRLAVGAVYIGLIALLAIGMDASFVDRSDRL
jgi:Zn-dependent protease